MSRGAPLGPIAVAATLLLFQIGMAARLPTVPAAASDLPAAPSAAWLRLASLGETAALSRIVMLWLQGFDSQPGTSVAFRDLDYGRLVDWLDRVIELDPRGQYPLLAASRIYGEVAAPAKQRLMLDFVHRQFLRDPERRWRWLAHAAIVARHQLRDRALALRYARSLRENATGPSVPGWATQMEAFMLEDFDEAGAAEALLGAMLASGSIRDAGEARFLTMRLDRMRARLREREAESSDWRIDRPPGRPRTISPSAQPRAEPAPASIDRIEAAATQGRTK